MKKILVIASMLALASCGQNFSQPDTTTPVQTTHCDVVTLPNVTVTLDDHVSTITMRKDGKATKVYWRAGSIYGADNVSPINDPDVVRLGCKDGVEFSEVPFN
jgi:hypothetical protein